MKNKLKKEEKLKIKQLFTDQEQIKIMKILTLTKKIISSKELGNQSSCPLRKSYKDVMKCVKNKAENLKS
jgi:hypothetical protein